ncbi:MAG TPA: hypothetical protein EYG98_07335 [Sulfurovum sp.]|nr:hypothetical protein [Sulfurovum sp.]
MSYPTFFDDAPTIKLYDPLGDFLGAFDNGDTEITYFDCVKLAGHSCPTVASAFLIALQGLKELFPDSLPQRSQIKVTVKKPKDEGVTGVIGNVISYIVGANDESGFKGIGGKFARDNLTKFGVSKLLGDIELTRIDTGASVIISADTSVVPGSPDMMPLMQKCMQGTATIEERNKFKSLWQSRVKTMLLQPELWSKIVTINKED